MKRICVFDVNETLLDLKALDGPFDRIFGKAGVRQQWFAQLLQSALVSTVTDAYVDFGTVGRAALEMVARRNGREMTDADREAIFGTVRSLPPHPEVGEALGRLRSAGFRLATLTNSTEAVARAQLEHAGLIDLFERTLSADAVQRLKPAPSHITWRRASLASRSMGFASLRPTPGTWPAHCGRAPPPRSSLDPASCWIP